MGSTLLPLCSTLISVLGSWWFFGDYLGLFAAACSLLRAGWLCLSCFMVRKRGMAPSRAQFISPSWAELHWGSSCFSPSTIKGIQTTCADLHIPADDTESWMDGPGIILPLSKPEDFFVSKWTQGDAMNSKPCGTTRAPPHPPNLPPLGTLHPTLHLLSVHLPWKRIVSFTGVAQGRNSGSHQAKIKEKIFSRSKGLCLFFFNYLFSCLHQIPDRLKGL